MRHMRRQPTTWSRARRGIRNTWKLRAGMGTISLWLKEGDEIHRMARILYHHG